MQLWIMRHAEASFEAPSDALRSLTAKGKLQAKDCAKALQAFAPELVLTSGYVRAEETLALLELKDAAHLTDERFSPDAGVQGAAAKLLSLSADRVLVVSHMPLVSKLHQWLTGVSLNGFSLAEVRAYDWSLQMRGEARLIELGPFRDES